MRRVRTAASLIEALRRLGAFRRKRTIVLGDQVYRVRRDRLVRIPDRWAHPGGIAGSQRKRRGCGENGRMDWERQRQVMRDYSRSKRRHFSFFTKDVERRRRKRLDQWNLRASVMEWLYAWEINLDYDHWDEYDWDDNEERGTTWSDPGWSVTLLDLMR